MQERICPLNKNIFCQRTSRFKNGGQRVFILIFKLFFFWTKPVCWSDFMKCGYVQFYEKKRKKKSYKRLPILIFYVKKMGKGP